MSQAALKQTAAQFHSPAAWRGSELAQSTDWIYVLSAEQQEEIVRIGRALETEGASLAEARLFTKRRSSEMPALHPLLTAVREDLRIGRGFALMRGFPVKEMSPLAVRLAYAALGSVLGLSMPQNRQGELLHDVRDTGANRHDPNVRLSITNAEQDFHTDAADIIGLICLQKSKSGGVSRIVSSVSVYNEVAAARPELAPMLFQPWYFHLKGEQPAGAPPYFRLPIAQVINGQLSSFFIGWYIRHAELLDGVPKLTSEQHELLKLYEQTANRPDLFLDMHFEPGDIQWLKNSVILHKRTEYEDFPEPERRRHLLRLWLAAPDFADGIVAIRQGHQASVS
jgi:hypothetical protein